MATIEHGYRPGETDIRGKVSRCGDEPARTVLYEAADAPLVRSQEWSGLRAWGLKIAEHRGMARSRAAARTSFTPKGDVDRSRGDDR